MMSRLMLLFLFVTFTTLVKAESSSDLVGKWKGEYVGCGQGVPTNAEIDVYDNLNAVFRFYASASSLGEFDGIFHGTMQLQGDEVVFKPLGPGITAWFIRPAGVWVSIAFVATLDNTGVKMSGDITSTAGCTKIELTKNDTSTVSSDLSIYMPSLKYQNANLWAELEYLGQDSKDQHTWGLKEFGVNEE